MMYVGYHPWLPDQWNKGHKAIRGGNAGLTHRRVLNEDHEGVCARLFERLK